MTTRVTLFVTAVAAGATVTAAAAVVLVGAAADRGDLVAFALVTLGLQLYAVRVPWSGHISVSAVGTIACIFALGAPWTMAIAAGLAVVQLVRSRGQFHRAVFDASQWVLATGVAAVVYAAVATGDPGWKVVAAALAGAAYMATSNTLLCAVIALSESTSPLAVWNDRFRAACFHYLAYGPLALAWMTVAERTGVTGIVLFAAVPAALLLTLRPVVERLRTSAEATTPARQSAA